ncbi:hypothetical protein EVAR_58044_1 [Eumeta japonica]|uniref:Uncharacterized protein n=1 Tax=Eumeta variegata TaxID=151549 RepID=A0A4C1YY29_EUMVA|nr:hypothetical protein EVAR_58044_1 [Eumeta japonica]
MLIRYHVPTGTQNKSSTCKPHLHRSSVCLCVKRKNLKATNLPTEQAIKQILSVQLAFWLQSKIEVNQLGKHGFAHNLRRSALFKLKRSSDLRTAPTSNFGRALDSNFDPVLNFDLGLIVDFDPGPNLLFYRPAFNFDSDIDQSFNLEKDSAC